MGGNALSKPSVRLARADYLEKERWAVTTLQAEAPRSLVEAIPAYASKETFGDLDILISTGELEPMVAAEALSAEEVVRNGPVTSLGVWTSGGLFQVDLIYIDKDSFGYAHNYFSYNDLGNLVGRVAHKMGLSHKHNGLYFPVRDGDYKFKEICLTKDYLLALEFLGFSPDVFQRGFNTLEDIFKYVVDSDFFSKEIYLLENRNYASRVRDRKRHTYHEFLKWMELNPRVDYKYPQDKSTWMDYIFLYFPDFAQEYEGALRELAKIKEVKEKFNGTWVYSLTGAQGKELGALMARFKSSFPDHTDMVEYLLTQPQSEIAFRVRRTHAELQKENQ